jgi:hypothetical protein
MRWFDTERGSILPITTGSHRTLEGNDDDNKNEFAFNKTIKGIEDELTEQKITGTSRSTTRQFPDTPLPRIV